MSKEIVENLKMHAREIKRQQQSLQAWLAVMKKANIDTSEIEAEL